MLISSNIDKLKYKKNIKLNKTKLNGLKKDSIIKTDVIYEIKHSKISFCVGKVPINLVNEYIESHLDRKDKVYE